MRKLVALFLFLLLLPGVSASSSIVGWLRFPAEVGLQDASLLVKDVSLSDGSILVYPRGDIPGGMRVVPVGGRLSWTDYAFSFGGIVYGTELTYMNISFDFPYLLEGKKLVVGEYELLLKSVSEKEGTILVSNATDSKELKCPAGKEVSYGNLRISLDPMPVLFRGYLERGQKKTVGEWEILFANYTVSSENDQLVEVVDIRVNGEQYLAEPGDSIDAGGIIITVGDLVGSDYLRVEVTLKGAYVRLKVLPSFEGWLREKKTEKLGPYLVRVEKVIDDSAYVSIMNPCGRVLKSGFISVGSFSSGIYYHGLLMGAAAVREREGVKELHVVAFLDPDKLPRLEEVAMLNVSLLAPERVIQYVPFNVTVVVRNEGPNDVRYVEIRPELSEGFKVLGEYPRYVEGIARGDELRLSLKVLPEKAGNLSLGSVAVIGHVPYDLSCYGVERITFTSENRELEVLPARVEYRVSITASNGTVGKPIPINVTVTNIGNAPLPFTLTVALPEGFGSIAENFTAYGKWLGRTDKLPPNASRSYSILAIPLSPGEYEISAGVEAYGEVFHNSTTITVLGPVSPVAAENSSSSQQSNTTCEPEVITKVIKVPVPSNETNTTVPAGGLSTKEKLIYIGGSFVGGILFILLLAWIAARMEER